MIKASVTPHDAVDLLNELARIAPSALAGLLASRVHVGQAIADHPTVQVGQVGPGLYDLGLLGLLNGLFGTYPNGWGCLVSEMVPGQPETLRFRVLEEVEARNGLS